MKRCFLCDTQAIRLGQTCCWVPHCGLRICNCRFPVDCSWLMCRSWSSSCRRHRASCVWRIRSSLLASWCAVSKVVVVPKISLIPDNHRTSAWNQVCYSIEFKGIEKTEPKISHRNEMESADRKRPGLLGLLNVSWKKSIMWLLMSQ